MTGGVVAIAALGLTDAPGTPTNQTNFKLNTYLLPYATKELARTLDQSISGSDSVSLVRSMGMGKNPTGDIRNINTPGTIFFHYGPLAANEVITTGWILYNDYQSLSILSFLDVLGAANSLKLEFSHDGGATIIETNQQQLVDLNIFRTSTFPIHRGNSIRISYTNGATPSTLTRFRVKLHTEMQAQLASNFLKMSGTVVGLSTKTLLQLPNTNTVSGTYDFVTRTGNSMNVNVTNLISGVVTIDNPSIAVSNFPTTQGISGNITSITNPVTFAPPTTSFYNNANIDETRNLKSGAGVFERIIINQPTTGLITIYNSLTGGGNIIARIVVGPPPPFYLYYGVNFSTGLTYVSASGAGNFTMVWR